MRPAEMKPEEMGEAILRAAARPPDNEPISFRPAFHSLEDLQRASNLKGRKRLVDIPDVIFGDAPAGMASSGFETITLEMVAALPFERFVSREVDASAILLAVLETSELRLAVDLPPSVKILFSQASALRRRTVLLSGLSSGMTAGIARIYRRHGNAAEGLAPGETWPALATLTASYPEVTEEHVDTWAADQVTLRALRDGARSLLELDNFAHLSPETQLAAIEAAQRSKLVNFSKLEAGSAVALPLLVQRVGLAIEEAKTWRQLRALLDDLIHEDAG